MMKNNNVVVMSGNVCVKPEIRSTGAGKKVTNIRLAVNEGKDQTMFIDVVAWESQAEFAEKYFDKGSRIGVIGRLTSREYEKEGNKVRVYEVVADSVCFDGPPKKESDDSDEAKPSSKKGATDGAAPKAPAAKKPAPAKTDDDLPF